MRVSSPQCWRSHLDTNILEAFTKNSPRMKTFAFFIIASNVLIVGGYVLYAKRKESSSKKWM